MNAGASSGKSQLLSGGSIVFDLGTLQKFYFGQVITAFFLGTVIQVHVQVGKGSDSKFTVDVLELQCNVIKGSTEH